jgi:hypothetical protein
VGQTPHLKVVPPPKQESMDALVKAQRRRDLIRTALVFSVVYIALCFGLALLMAWATW